MTNRLLGIVAGQPTDSCEAPHFQYHVSSDLPDALVPRLARVQGLIAFARDQHEEATRRLEESIAGWERLLERTVRADSITTSLADLGRPVVGLVEPERELARARADLGAIQEGKPNAVVP